MAFIKEGASIMLKNVLYLTDFSESSELALPFAIAMARNYGASVHALHVLTPPIPAACREAIQADKELASAEMAKVGSQLAGVVHDTAVVHGATLWSAIEPAVQEYKVDLIVLGTHGRTGVSKLLLGSFAEEIFRRSSVPVLTVGRDVLKSMNASGRFRSILFATDFSKPSLAAAPFAVSLAEENDAQLVLLNVMPETGLKHHAEVAIGDVLHNLRELVPTDARMRCRPTAIVQHGEAADRILETAEEHGADLIVLGVRDAARHLGAATHLERATAHRVVAHARCPVLTVRG
jgi:nucleotide-binding universal stress UspA family protein